MPTQAIVPQLFNTGAYLFLLAASFAGIVLIVCGLAYVVAKLFGHRRSKG